MKANYLAFSLVLSGLIVLSACEQQQPESNTTDKTPQVSDSVASANALPERKYDALYLRIDSGGASMDEVNLALTNPDVVSLTKTTHALHAMVWNRAAISLMRDLWALNKGKHPKINWNLIEKAPVRIALASTLNRLEKPGQNNQYTDYIYGFKEDTDLFNQMQVVIAMGYMQDPRHVDYLGSRLDSESSLVFKNAVSALVTIGNEHANGILANFQKENKDNEMGAFVSDMTGTTAQ